MVSLNASSFFVIFITKKRIAEKKIREEHTGCPRKRRAAGTFWRNRPSQSASLVKLPMKPIDT